jgi:hypothetical protein
MLYAREAEIKHGRIAMLAFAGIVIETLGIKAPGAEKIYGSSTVSPPPHGHLPGPIFCLKLEVRHESKLDAGHDWTGSDGLPKS